MKDKHNFTGLKLELRPNCLEILMFLIIDSVATCNSELLSTDECYVFPDDDRALYYLVMFKMDGAETTRQKWDFMCRYQNWKGSRKLASCQ